MFSARRHWLHWLRTLWGVISAGASLGLAAGASTPAGGPEAHGGVSFRRDVMQLLSKAGCNAGACHGNANGKGGFKLSLRAEDAVADFRALVEEQGGRRINLLEPERSLILIKATAAIAHEGGQRFTNGSPAFVGLSDWLAAGAVDDREDAPRLTRLEVSPEQIVLVEPAGEVTVRAIAHFADGARRDVSREAVYETSNPFVHVSAEGRVRREQFGESVVLVRYLDQQQPVRIAFVPARPGFVWSQREPVNYVDKQVFAKLRQLRLNPAGAVGDALFLRRVHLDLLGRLPTTAEAQEFLADPRVGKRGPWIERLLERPEFADFWALKWSDLLRVEERTLDPKGVRSFHGWIRDSFVRHKPMDEFARELITARGSTYAHPAANFYRANRTPVDRALAVSQVFLGVRLNCAQCHNHPFDRWSQDDYHDWAAVFGRINYKVLRNDRKDDNDSHEFKGEQIVYLTARGDVPNPRTGKSAVARMLGTAVPLETIRASVSAASAVKDAGGADELEILAKWLTSPTNRAFARVQANRVWFQLLGRGLVDPMDDFRATNPASHPELLEALADDFIRSGYDLRQLIRTIMSSHTYQVGAGGDDAEDELNYSRATARRLSAEQLLDAEYQVTGVPFSREFYPGVTRVVQLPGGSPLKLNRAGREDGFLQVFGKPKRLLTCDCERSESTSMAQALELISGPALNQLIAHPENLLGRWLASDPSGKSAVSELYWSALTRAPQPAEQARAEALLAAAATADARRAVLEDVTWALLNSKEFLFRQ